ncbi:MAG: hypothetical protein HZC44_10890 [Geobacter sp.]|nr:hypothetical protein [Geobacter sp.]
MKCPKCGYNSFEYLNTCRKCGIDLAGFKNTLGLRPVILPPAVSAQHATEIIPAGETPAPVEAAETASAETFHWETPVDTEAAIPQLPEISPFALDLDEAPTPPAAPVEPFAFIDQPSTDSLSVPTESTESPASVTLSDFSFDEQEPTEPEQPAVTTEIPASSIDSSFGEFVFGEEPVASAVETAPASPPISDESPFGEFAFGEEPAVPAAEAAPAPPPVSDESPFGEFAFGEEPAVPATETASPAPPVIDESSFGEFAFGEEPVAQSVDPAPPAAAEMNPFGEFAFDEEPALATAQTAAPDFNLETFGDLTEEQLQHDAGIAPEEFELESFQISAGATPATEGQEKKTAPGGTQFTKDEFDALFGELAALEKKN